MPTLTDPRYTAYRWAADRITSAVKGPKWQVWDGKTSLGAKLPVSACGAASITPEFEAEEDVAGGGGEQITQAPVRLVIEVGTTSADLAQSAALWARIQAAFEPDARTRQAREDFRRLHAAAGISWIEFGQPAIGAATKADSTVAGWVRLMVFLSR